MFRRRKPFQHLYDAKEAEKRQAMTDYFDSLKDKGEVVESRILTYWENNMLKYSTTIINEQFYILLKDDKN